LRVLRNKDYVKNPKLLAQVKTLFQRVVHQVKAAWIFFQFDFMLVLQDFLNRGHVNNALMKGIATGSSATDRVTEQHELELKAIITAIVRQFLDAFERNRLLGVECLFRFTSREHKDSILSNYESITPAAA
jgi:hypothetical protein